MARYQKLQLLIDLQEITAEQLRIERDLSGLPERCQTLTLRCTETQAIVEEARTNVQALRLEQQKEETSLKEIEAKLAAKKEQLSTVRTNAEFTAIKKELGYLEAAHSETEDRILFFMEQIAKAEEMLAKLEQDAAEAKEAYEREVGPLQEQIALLHEQLQAVVQRAQEVRAQVEPRWLRVFDRLAPSKRGIVVVPVDGSTCGGCHATLPLAVLEAVRFGQEIVTCDNCSRVLYHIEENG